MATTLRIITFVFICTQLYISTSIAQNLLCGYDSTWVVKSSSAAITANITECTVDVTNQAIGDAILIVPGSTTYTDYDVTLQFSMDLTASNSYGSLLFRISDTNVSTMTGFEMQLTNSTVSLVYDANAVPTSLQSIPYAFIANQLYSFRIIAFDTYLWLYIDVGAITKPSSLIAFTPNPYNSPSASPTTPPLSGAIGFRATGATSFQFTSLTVDHSLHSLQCSRNSNCFWNTHSSNNSITIYIDRIL